MIFPWRPVRVLRITRRWVLKRSSGRRRYDPARVPGSSCQRDEGALLLALRTGPEAAFDWLVERYQFEVYGLASHMLGDPQAAAEVTATIFVRSLSGFGELLPGTSPRVWLYRISFQELLAPRPARRRNREHNTSAADRGMSRSPAAEASGASAFPSTDGRRTAEEQTAMHQGLSGLPKHLRAVLILRDFAGLSYEETAEVLNLPLRAVKFRVLQGRRALRDLLDPALRSKLAT